jgi:hypothetical protein
MRFRRSAPCEAFPLAQSEAAAVRESPQEPEQQNSGRTEALSSVGRRFEPDGAHQKSLLGRLRCSEACGPASCLRGLSRNARVCMVSQGSWIRRSLVRAGRGRPRFPQISRLRTLRLSTRHKPQNLGSPHSVRTSQSKAASICSTRGFRVVREEPLRHGRRIEKGPPCSEEPSARSTVRIRVSAGSIAIARASNAEASQLVTQVIWWRPSAEQRLRSRRWCGL